MILPCGDTNLDGVVDGSAYSRIDNGYLQKLTGWYNGDFNYDRVVNGSDYTLIDNAFNNQGASLADIVASPTTEIADAYSVQSQPALVHFLLHRLPCWAGENRFQDEKAGQVDPSYLRGYFVVVHLVRLRCGISIQAEYHFHSR